MLLLVALGLWFAFAPLDDVVRGTGRIIPQEHTQTIQHLEGGIVDEILVQEGQTVAKGAPLFRLHDQLARTARDEQAIGIHALALKKLRLEAEQKGASRLDFPEDVAKANPEQAAAERTLFSARLADFQHQISVVQEQIHQKQLQLADIQEQVKRLTTEQVTAQKQLDINQKLREGGALSETRLLETQAQVQSLATRIAQAQGQMPIVQSGIAELSKRASQIREERQSKIADELNTTNVQLQQYEERDKSLGDRLTRTTITAPSNGIINRLLMTTTGGVVQPGAAVAELTPTDSPLLVEGKLAARDRAHVWNGLKVKVRVSAYDYAQFGALDGTIQDISPDSLKDDQGNVFYRLRITLDRSNMAQGKPLLPGMTVDFYVHGERQSALWQITEPLRRMFVL
jgi:HlyD family type I secretion membrane fusion protein